VPEPPVKSHRKRRPRTGRVMRHVLRARAEAARALASFIGQLENAPPTKRVCASAHLAKIYGRGVKQPDGVTETTRVVVPSQGQPVGGVRGRWCSF